MTTMEFSRNKRHVWVWLSIFLIYTMFQGGFSISPSERSSHLSSHSSEQSVFLSFWSLLFGGTESSSSESEELQQNDLRARINDNRRKLSQTQQLRDDEDEVAKNVLFHLFSDPTNPNAYHTIKIEDITSTNPLPSWDSTLPTKILIHGFTADVNAAFPQNVKNAYLKRQGSRKQYNIIVVDWGQLAAYFIPNYFEAVKNVVPTGHRVGLLISCLLSTRQIHSLSQVHVVGHSLGAHVAGAAGDWVRKNMGSGSKLGRISGLDPAGPLFYTSAKITGRQLTTDDAEFVDIHYCNMGGLGTSVEIGDVQFYLNYIPAKASQIQPQCKNEGLLGRDGCSHNYCPKFWALSVLERREATSISAASLRNGGNYQTVVFGEDLNMKERGKFYVKIEEVLEDDMFVP